MQQRGSWPCSSQRLLSPRPLSSPLTDARQPLYQRDVNGDGGINNELDIRCHQQRDGRPEPIGVSTETDMATSCPTTASESCTLLRHLHVSAALVKIVPCLHLRHHSSLSQSPVLASYPTRIAPLPPFLPVASSCASSWISIVARASAPSLQLSELDGPERWAVVRWQ